jgi:glycine/D-amino acid oxidase-like deaminating enzyme
MLPKSVKYCVIGAGVHGLSTAWHLARQLKAAGRGSARDVLVLDKTAVAAGASGIACGVVRNFYFQPAMGEVMRVSVEIWENHRQALHYHPVGYLALASEIQARDLETIAARHEASGYRASLIRGEDNVARYMHRMFPDWKARGLTVCLHEHQGGFAFNKESMHGLANLARSEGVEILSGVTVTGFRPEATTESVAEVLTNRGPIAVDQVVVAVGPWIKQLWQMLGLPERIDIRTGDRPVSPTRKRGNPNTSPTRKRGTTHGVPMWTYWQLQEGEIAVDPAGYTTAAGETPPVLHIDSTEPLVSDRTGRLITRELWGVYFKRDRAGVQGGAVPLRLGTEAQVDPYGPASPHYTAGDSFADYWTAGLAHCLGRFEGKSSCYKQAPSGGIGCFTADNFPVFDWMRPNVYVIADSNHGYKMIGVGKEVARVLLGEKSAVLFPFRFARFAEGDLHPVSNSPFPWS